MSLGVYIHVPFCVKKCSYCDFVSYPYGPKGEANYLLALEKEMAYYHHLLPTIEKPKTIFIGGGTPTVLTSEALEKLLTMIQRFFPWQTGAEVTMEANPGTVDKEKLSVLRKQGVNRLSLGVQASQMHLLQLLGRIHDFHQAEEAVDLARQVGFKNISLDLISSLPGQTLLEWRETLTKAVALKPEHLSCYSLQLEEGTPLATAVSQGRLIRCDEEIELAMYEETIHFLQELGYEQYEISNFATPGFQSRHNLRYWHNQHYLGFGPAAHSYFNQKRWSNVSGLQEYADKLNENQPPLAEEIFLSEKERMSETVFMGLRLIEGVNLEHFQQCFGKAVTDVWPEEIKKLEKRELLTRTDTHLKLTAKGLPLANLVFVEFV